MSEDQDAAGYGTVPSPCVRNCCLDRDNVCMGCYRTIGEICAWHDASENEKIETLARCRSRYTERFARLADVKQP